MEGSYSILIYYYSMCTPVPTKRNQDHPGVIYFVVGLASVQATQLSVLGIGFQRPTCHCCTSPGGQSVIVVVVRVKCHEYYYLKLD